MRFAAPLATRRFVDFTGSTVTQGEFTMAQPFTLPPLPFAEGALAPVILAQTIGFHYGKHHKTYVDTLNKLVAGTEFGDMPLEKIIKATAEQSNHAAIFNN